MAQQTLVPAALDGVEPLTADLKDYAQKEYAQVRQPDGTTKRVATGALTGKVLTGLSFQPATAAGQNIGKDVWLPPYRDVLLRIAATCIAEAATLLDAPTKTSAAASTSTRVVSRAEFLARQAATANGTASDGI